MPYRSTAAEMSFYLDHVVDFAKVTATEKFADATPETVTAILAEAGKLAEDVMAPLNRIGDTQPSRLENGVVRCPPGFKEAYAAIAEGGWLGICAPEDQGGMGLPITVASCVNEMMNASCLALALNPLMSLGQIEALEAHASDEIKDRYLDKLISGEWTGTMNLTEPQAGSDVGALRTKAEANGDGSYAITGQKIYISWGDHDLTDNIVHLVLARLPDGVPGTKGISLFVVPKFLPGADGSPGVANDLRPVSLEHKMGLHGSPTAVMEYAGATGWLVGPEHGGMAAMFTMMNNARLGVGVQGLGCAEGALQAAKAFAMDRKQGRSMIEGGAGTIIDHADVRRMLLEMQAKTSIARAICLDCAIALDMASATGRADWAARAAFLTPIAKAFGTDAGCEVASTGIQVHGGMGYIEETGAAQFYRDCRVTAIYEGTNGIQAMDLVARKMMDQGAAAYALLDEINTQGHPRMAAAVQALRDATEWMVAAEPNDRFAGATRYLRAFAYVLGGHYLVKAGAADDARMPLARFFVRHMLPEVHGLCAGACEGAEVLYELSPEVLTA